MEWEKNLYKVKQWKRSEIMQGKTVFCKKSRSGGRKRTSNKNVTHRMRNKSKK
jgi:hypothetical protein